jgi:hypothetical protein
MGCEDLGGEIAWEENMGIDDEGTRSRAGRDRAFGDVNGLSVKRLARKSVDS